MPTVTAKPAGERTPFHFVQLVTGGGNLNCEDLVLTDAMCIVFGTIFNWMSLLNFSFHRSLLINTPTFPAQ